MHGHAVNDKIKTFIHHQFPLARRKEIGGDDPLLETGIIDSLGVLDVVTFLEHEFSIHVADDELVPQNFQTINRLVDFVRAKKNGAGG